MIFNQTSGTMIKTTRRRQEGAGNRKLPLADVEQQSLARLPEQMRVRRVDRDETSAAASERSIENPTD